MLLTVLQCLAGVEFLSRYALVDAPDEAAARELGCPALHDLYADVRQRLGREVSIEIHTVRPATTDEIDLMKWHNQMVAREAERQARRNPA